MIRYLFALVLLAVASQAALAQPSQQEVTAKWQHALALMVGAAIARGDVAGAAQAEVYVYEQSHGLVGNPAMYGLAAMPRTRSPETRCTTTTGFGGRETYTSCRQE